MEILAAIPLIVFGLIVVASLIWVYGDAEERGSSGCLVVLMVILLTWPVGLVVWLVFRPKRAY